MNCFTIKSAHIESLDEYTEKYMDDISMEREDGRVDIWVWNYPSCANIRIPDSFSVSYPDIRISAY